MRPRDENKLRTYNLFKGRILFVIKSLKELSRSDPATVRDFIERPEYKAEIIRTLEEFN